MDYKISNYFITLKSSDLMSSHAFFKNTLSQTKLLKPSQLRPPPYADGQNDKAESTGLSHQLWRTNITSLLTGQKYS